MVGGCLSCFFTYISVLLLGFCLHDVEASRCEHVIHKTVGDTVELSSCSPTEEVFFASWRHRVSPIEKYIDVSQKDQFKGRFNQNPQNFSLTVRRLTLQDSGDFIFLSEDKHGKQRNSVTITLHVHEPITKKPVVTSNSTWHSLNQSCTVLLECSMTAVRNATYSWTVRNQTTSGSRLQYVIKPEDEDIQFTCTVSNYVSGKSTVKPERCSNNTSDPLKPGPNFIFILGVAGGACLMIVAIIGAMVCVCQHKHSQTGSDSNDLTVYADISDVAIEGTSTTMKPCTLYETIDNKVNTAQPGPQTVYDKIQFSRMREASVSPYQDVS